MIVTFDTRTQKEAALLVLTMCLHLGQVSSLKGTVWGISKLIMSSYA